MRYLLKQIVHLLTQKQNGDFLRKSSEKSSLKNRISYVLKLPTLPLLFSWAEG
jgi:hypothetical protein